VRWAAATSLEFANWGIHKQAGVESSHEKEPYMLWTIFVILLVLWLLGLVSSYTLGGYIHILLVVAVVVLIFNLLSGRRSAL
jgi:hypothetical protein